VEALQEAFGSDRYSFYTGVGYRHIMKRKGEALDVRSFPPHDVMGKVLGEILPSGPGAAEIVGLMKRSQGLLESHPVNVGRRERGEKSANMIWLWGDGPRPRMPSFQESFGLSGACITAVDLIRGIGILLGWKHIAVKGATGYLDTDYAAKGEAAVWAMEGHDLVFVHIEAPDEAGHEGDARAKCESIARVDELIVEPILRAAAKRGGTRFAVLGDHFTPVKLRTHSGEPVPFAVWGPGISSSGCAGFGERSARSSGLFVEEGHQFMERFIGGEFHDPGAREKSPGRRRGGGC
jgi:2,3-bisphosphoglycerate-independent phosphoglycerate mutase